MYATTQASNRRRLSLARRTGRPMKQERDALSALGSAPRLKTKAQNFFVLHYNYLSICRRVCVLPGKHWQNAPAFDFSLSPTWSSYD